jgi:hypothetical protein
VANEQNAAEGAMAEEMFLERIFAAAVIGGSA